MIRNSVVNTVNFFYPLGNTPAVSLTQDLPFGKEADILSLGCGDARNVLFTCVADPHRKLNITCCDIEPAIIARNILLYTLIIDDVKHMKINEIWNIYYHWKLDEKSSISLEDQLEKLLQLSVTSMTWRQSTYGPTIRFCDERTLRRVREFWISCSTRGLSEDQKSKRSKVWQTRMNKAQKIKRDVMGGGTSIAGYRSAAPNGVVAIADFSTVAERWWGEGVTVFSNNINTKPTHLNSTYLSSTNENVTLHYGTDPLLGFPLAAAYVSLKDDSPLFVKRSGMSSADYLTACAQKQFRTWVDAFSSSLTKGLNLRFCIADALSLSFTLKNAVPQEDGRLCANLFCDNWTVEPLLLDKNEFAAQKHALPCYFDVIDTSNLVDHLGALNLIPLCASLLKSEATSTLYTECLVQNDSSERERIAGFLGGEIRTIALLLGLSPCEIWTNATNSLEDESFLTILNQEIDQAKINGSTQIRSRLRWKRIRPNYQNDFPPSVHIETSQAAQFCVMLYNHMFSHENILSLMTMGLGGLTKSSNPYYNRASFAFLLKHIQETVVTNWENCFDQMKDMIFSEFPNSPMGANFAQELLLYMHMLGMDTTTLPSIDLTKKTNAKLAPLFKTWSDIPTYICITIRVPRKKLEPLTSVAGTKVGTPALKCDVESGDTRSNPWANSFASVQVAFGESQIIDNSGLLSLQITEDKLGWCGLSDMFASTIVPTWMLLQNDGIVPIMKCGLLPTVHTGKLFAGALGLKLDIFYANFMSENVTISKYMPAMIHYPKIITKGLPAQMQSHYSMNAMFSDDGTSIIGLVQRISFISDAERSFLGDRSIPVKVQFLDLFRASLKVGEKIKTFLNFPVPMNHFLHKVRIARKSSYVEIEAPLWSPLADSSANFLCPVMVSKLSSVKSSGPVALTATTINLDTLSVMDLAHKNKLDWLRLHLSMMFSSKERQVRGAGMANHVPYKGPNIRLEIKEGVFSMFMSFTGLQGDAAKYFGLSKSIGGINIIFIPDHCRLDYVNRTTVLDAAAIPLTDIMHTDKKVSSFFQSLTSVGVLQIKVSDEEMRCWKTMLPALVERCRVWEHMPDCEYANKEEVPLRKGLEDGKSPLCKCGIGKFPPDYLKDAKVDNLKYILKHYGTRLAISPIFPLPYVEDGFLAGLSLDNSSKKKNGASTNKNGCANCGRRSKKNAFLDDEKLLICSKCKKTKYCSVDCQKADWKSHKRNCATSNI